jgi:hypothetical protein
MDDLQLERQSIVDLLGRRAVRMVDGGGSDRAIALGDGFELLWRFDARYPAQSAPNVAVRLLADDATAKSQLRLAELNAFVQRVCAAHVRGQPLMMSVIEGVLARIQGRVPAHDESVVPPQRVGAPLSLLPDDDDDGLLTLDQLAEASAQTRSVNLAAYRGYCRHAVVQIKTKLHAFGGIEKTEQFGTDAASRKPSVPRHRVLDLVSRKWSEVHVQGAPFWLGVSSAVRCADSMFVLGEEHAGRAVLCRVSLGRGDEPARAEKLALAVPPNLPMLAVHDELWIIGGAGEMLVCAINVRTEQRRSCVPTDLGSMHSHTATRVGHFILLHGGVVDGEVSNATFVIDVLRETVSRVAIDPTGPQPRFRRSHCAVLFGGVVLFIGGREFSLGYCSVIDLFCLRTHRWHTKTVAGPPLAFEGMTATLIGSTILMLGGRAESRKRGSFVYAEDGTLLDIGAKPVMPASTLPVYVLALRLERGDVPLVLRHREFHLHSFVLRARCPRLLVIATTAAHPDGAALEEHVDGLDDVLDWIYGEVRCWQRRSALADRAAFDVRSSHAAACASVLRLDAVARDIVENAPQPTAAALESMQTAMGRFFDDDGEREASADFFVVAGGTTFGVHRAALRRFPFFRRLLDAGMIEASSRRLVLPDQHSAGAARALLRFVYTDRLVADADDAVDLLALASLYEIAGLRLSAVSLIQSYFDFADLESVLHLFQVSLTFESAALKRSCTNALRADFAFVDVMNAAQSLLTPESAAALRRALSQ